jgi:hypothetical protein
MSGGTVPPPLPQQSPTPTGQPVVLQESPLGALIEDRILKTRRQVKGVDIIAGLLTLIVGTTTYLFVAALIDHWLVTGGLDFWQRVLIWAILISAAGLYFVKYVWPSLVLSINPVFAARTIEQTKSSLKNSLINFLLLRGRQTELSPVIYQALEQRAASDLKGVHIETAVDRRPVLHLSFLLLVVVGVICLYLAISPKNPLISAERILWPWSNLLAPTRVTIENVMPGDTVSFHGDFVTVSADVRGLNEGEAVLLHYSTADGEAIDQSIPMPEENGVYRRQAKLPPDNLGLQQNYTYFITAGDFKTAIYNIETQISPDIDIDKVDYHYPSYTGIADNSVERQGDIRAIEGTQITIHATANQPIERAEIDFSGSGMRGIKMNADGRKATGRFTLHMLPEDPTRAEHDFYQLRFTDKNHRENRRPIRYNIVVLPDPPPKVQIVEPKKDETNDETNVAEDGKLEIRVWAEDSDYGLRRVVLRAEQENRILNIPPLLDIRPPEKPETGQYQGKFEFEPKNLKLKAGDRVAYWAEAEDNKEPSPNVTASGKQWIVVVAPDNLQTKNDQQPHLAKQPGQQTGKGTSDQKESNQRPNEQPQAGQQQDDHKQQQKPEEKGEKGGKGAKDDQSKQNIQPDSQQSATDQSQADKKDESSQSGKGNDKSAQSESGQNPQQSAPDQANKAQEPIDPNANPGDAIQKMLEHRQEEQQKEQQKSQPADQQQNNQQQNDQQQSGQQQSGQQQSGQQQFGNQQSDNQQSGKQQSGNQQTGDKQTGNHKSGDKQTSGSQSANGKQQGSQQPGKQQSGNQKSDNQQTGKQQTDNQQTIAQQSGNPQPGDNQTQNRQSEGQQKTGVKSGDQSQTGQRPNNQQTGVNQPEGNKQSADQNAGGQQQTGDKQQPGNQQPDDKQTGDKQSATGKQAGNKQPGEKQPSTDMQPGDKQLGDKQSSDKESATGKQPGDKQPSGDARPSDSKQGGDKQQPADAQKSGSRDKLTDQQQTPGTGQGAEQPKPSPEAQGAHQQRPKQAGQSGQDLNKKQDEAQSPSRSPKQSDSKGDSAGDRSGGVKQGGGQKSDKPGTGSAGTQTPADQGGSQSDEQGLGELGDKPGDQAQSGEPADSAAKQPSAKGSKGQKQPDGGKSGNEGSNSQQQSGDSSTGQGRQKPPEGSQAGNQMGQGPSARGSGNPTGGGQQGTQTDVTNEPEAQESAADAINLDYARKQTELALEHLEDQLAKDKPELLEQLGWTREQAQRFLDRWQQLRQAADEKGPRGEAAKRQLDDALKSLGLRPGTTYIQHGGIKADQMRDMRDSGRFAPPPDWAEQFREYTRGVANQGKEQGTGK